MASSFRGKPVSTTIARPRVSSAARATRTSRNLVSLPQMRLAAADCSDPVRLAKVLTDTQTQVLRTLRPSQTNPINGGVLLQGIICTSGTSQTVYHGLGRPWVGYFVVRSQTAAIAFRDTSLPAGLNASQAIQLVPSATGTADLWVF